MDSKTIYRKTERGTVAIRERPAFLSPQLRSLLIMVDGAKTVADLLQFNGVMGDIGKGLERLEAEGLIEASFRPATPPPAVVAAVAVVTPTAAPQASVPPKAVSATAVGMGLVAFQRQAARALLEGMGPMADSVCLRLERTKTASDALQVAENGVQMLVDSRRPEAAAKLRELIAQFAGG